MTPFAHFLADQIAAYVQLRRGLGLVFRTQAATLASFQRFVAERATEGPLLPTLVDEYLAGCSVTKRVHAKRYSVLRHFAQYLWVHDPRTAVPASTPVPWTPPAVPPRILSDDDSGDCSTPRSRCRFAIDSGARRCTPLWACWPAPVFDPAR